MKVWNTMHRCLVMSTQDKELLLLIGTGNGAPGCRLWEEKLAVAEHEWENQHPITERRHWCWTGATGEIGFAHPGDIHRGVLWPRWDMQKVPYFWFLMTRMANYWCCSTVSLQSMQSVKTLATITIIWFWVNSRLDTNLPHPLPITCS